MHCPTCHRDQPEELFRRASRLLKACAPCREKRAAARRARAARDPEGERAGRREAKGSRVGARPHAVPKIALDIPAAGLPFRVRLYHADARDLLGGTERPDLIVTDPPYGIDPRPETPGRILGDEDMKLGYAVLSLAIRRLRPGGQTYVFGDARQPFLRHGLDRAVRPLVKVLQPLVWDEKGHLGLGGRSRPWGHSWEYITVWERLPDDGEADRTTLRRLPTPGPAFVEREATPSGPRPVLLPSRDRTGQQATTKPVELLKQIIAVASRIHDLVLDPFAGDGSTGIAALELGRRFLGIEAEEAHACTAGERIASARWPSVEEALVEEAHWGEGLGDWWEQIESP